MIKEFLKAGGVATVQEFYSKFPTAGHFSAAYPEAYSKICAKYGGGVPHAQDGMQIPERKYTAPPVQVPDNYRTRGNDQMPQEEDFNGDYGLYKQAIDAYTNSYTLPQAPPQLMPMRMVPNVSLEGPARINQPAAQQPFKNIKKYKGPSVVDMLRSQGLASSKASRKIFAENNNISNYTGTYDQNIKLMKMLQTNPELLKHYTDTLKNNAPTSPLLAKAIDNDIKQAAANPFIPQPLKKTPKKGQLDDSHTGAIIGAIMAATAVGGLSAVELLDVMMRMDSGKIGNFSGTGKAKLTKAINKLRSESLQKAGTEIKNTSEWFKKLPKQQQQILKSLDLAEIPGLNNKPGSAMKNVEAWKMAQEAAAEEKLLGFRNTNRMLGEMKAENVFANAYGTKRMVGEARAEQAVSNAAKVKKLLQEEQAAKALGLGSRLVKGAKETVEGSKYLKNIAGFLKGAKQWFREDGGEIEQYQLGGSGPFIYPGSAIQQWSNHKPDVKDDVASVFDPTGITNVPYVIDSMAQFAEDPSWGGAADLGWNLAGSMPFGIGQGIRNMRTGIKAAKTVPKAARAIRKITSGERAANTAGKVIKPVVKAVKTAGRVLEFPATQVNNLYKKSDFVTPAMINPANTFNRGLRGWNAAGTGVVDMLDWMAPGTPQKAHGGDTGTFSAGQYFQNGGQEGSVMEVTPEQLQMLKNNGYNFEIIN